MDAFERVGPVFRKSVDSFICNIGDLDTEGRSIIVILDSSG